MTELPGIAAATTPEALATLPLALAPALLLLTALLALLVPAGAALRRTLLAAGAASAAVVLLANAGPLAEGKRVLSVAARTVRVGSLDASIVLALDAVSLPLTLTVCASVVWLALRGEPAHVEQARAATANGEAKKSKAKRSEAKPAKAQRGESKHGGAIGDGRGEARSKHAAAWALAAAAAMTSLLGDGLGTWLLGVGGLVAATAVASSRVSLTRLSASGSGLLLVAFAGLLLFWTLGGRWIERERYLSDYRPRFAVEGANAPLGRAPLPREEGRLTMTGMPGSTVFLGVSDESLLSRATPFGVTPFVGLPLPAGVHKVAIVPGGGATVGGEGLEVALVDALHVHPDQETRIGVLGPTLAYAEARAQLDAPGLDLGARRIAGFRAIELVCLWMGAGLLLLAWGAPRLSRGGERLGATLLLLCVGGLAARVAPWFAIGTDARTLYGVAVVGLAAWVGLRPLIARDVTTLGDAPTAALVALAGVLSGPAAVVVASVAWGIALATSASAPYRARLLFPAALPAAIASAALVVGAVSHGLALGALAVLASVAASSALYGSLAARTPESQPGAAPASSIPGAALAAVVAAGLGVWLGAWSHSGGPTAGARFALAALAFAPVLALVLRLREAPTYAEPEGEHTTPDAGWLRALTRAAARLTELLDAPSSSFAATGSSSEARKRSEGAKR